MKHDAVFGKSSVTDCPPPPCQVKIGEFGDDSDGDVILAGSVDLRSGRFRITSISLHHHATGITAARPAHAAARPAHTPAQLTGVLG